MKITKRNPILVLANDFLIDSPLPSNISHFWSFGSLLGVNLVVLIISGLTLAMHYTPNTLLAFSSVEHIMRDVNNGWLLRLVHANAASLFFIFVYIHIARNLYYGSYRAPRGLLWSIGVAIFIVMMASIWPSWYEIIGILAETSSAWLSEVNSLHLDPLWVTTPGTSPQLFMASLGSFAFSRPNVRALSRIGPHDFEVVAYIIWS